MIILCLIILSFLPLVRTKNRENIEFVYNSNIKWSEFCWLPFSALPQHRLSSFPSLGKSSETNAVPLARCHSSNTSVSATTDVEKPVLTPRTMLNIRFSSQDWPRHRQTHLAPIETILSTTEHTLTKLWASRELSICTSIHNDHTLHVYSSY